MSDSYLKMKTEQQFFLVLVQSSSADKGSETNTVCKETPISLHILIQMTPSSQVEKFLARSTIEGEGADQNPWLGKMMGKSTERKLEPFYIVVLSIVRNYKECMHEQTKEK